MVVSGNYSQVQLNFRPFWEKPPGFIWLQALSMNIFGVNEFAARFPNAVCSIVSFISLYLIGKKFHSPKFGILWCLVYASLMLPHLYFKSGIIDPWFNLFIFISVYHIIIFTNNPAGKREIFNALGAGLFLGLAVLTKGPAAIVIVGLTLLAYLTWTKQLKLLVSKTFLIFGFTTLFVSGSWFLVEWLEGNQDVIKEFIDYQVRLMSTEDSGHGGPFIYHFAVILIGCFPASLVFIASYSKYSDLSPFQKQFRKMFICLFWVVILLFSIFVQTKIVHYSSLCYYPLTFVATIGLFNYFNAIKFSSVLKIIYWIISILITIAFAALPFINPIKKVLLSGNYIRDEFARENLKADVHWTGFEFLISLLFLCGSVLIYLAINKKKIKLIYYGLALNLLFIYSAILVIIPKVELYTQHAAIVFYKACAKNKCYVETNNFKSYAYLFYSNRQPSDYKNPDQIKSIEHHLMDAEKAGFTSHSFYANANCYWMKHGKIDRPAYIIAKKNEEKDMIAEKEFTKLYDKNGFSFFVRMPAVK
jgi:hypothetical protein